MTGLTPFANPLAAPARSLIDRLAKVSRPDLAEVALRELLTRKALSEVRPQDVRSILEEQFLNPNQVHDLRHRMWKAAYRAFASDNVISGEEHAYLEPLRGLLNIGSDFAIEVEEEIFLPRYRELMNRALADGQLSESERGQLARFVSDMRISPGRTNYELQQPTKWFPTHQAVPAPDLE